MNVFLWNHLKDRQMLSYVIRRKYVDPFEPAILRGWMPGVNYPDMLFPMTNYYLDADMAADLNTDDLMALDRYHAVGEGIHKRTCCLVQVMRFGRSVEVPTFVYVTGQQFSKLAGVSLK